VAVTLDYVEYPSGRGGRRQVHFCLPDAGTDPIGAALGRVAGITDGASATYASCTYLGDGSIVQITHPDVSGGLTLSHGSSGSYGGLDDLVGWSMEHDESMLPRGLRSWMGVGWSGKVREPAQGSPGSA